MMMTAEQAAEAARGLTFEKVWAALMESRERQEKAFAEADKRQEKAFAEMRESRKATDRQLQESREAADRRQKETEKQLKETLADMKRIVADVSHQMGGLHNTIGKMTEEMFSAQIWTRFDGIYTFTQGSPRTIRDKNRKKIAQVDMFLENGEYAMAVEIKTTLKLSDIDEHLEQLTIVRQYMDERGDRRKLVGAVAGAVVADDVCLAAQKKGLYVLTQSGEAVVLAEAPSGFRAVEW